jgi:two-component system, cell cycle response regulator
MSGEYEYVKLMEGSMGGKILIADDVATNRIVLKVKLAAAFYETFQSSSGAETLEKARANRPDLILLDVELPDLSGIEVCKRLKADPQTRDIPVVMVTAFRDMARKIEALEAGADEVFWKPLDEVVLLARLRSLLRARETAHELGMRQGIYRELGCAEPAAAFEPQALVGLISQQPETRDRWERELRHYISDRLVAMDPDQAMGFGDQSGIPDVFVLRVDPAQPGGGMRLMSELRSRQATRHAAICVVLPAGARDTAAMALDLGANDLLEADADPAEMALRIRMLIARKRQADRLRESLEDRLRLAMTDPLTGLHNRRYAMAHLARIAARADAAKPAFAVMVLDLDRFKSVNDTYGHAAGDAVLVEVAARLSAHLRPADLLARIGGEEFLVVLPESTLADARVAAERLRRAVADLVVTLPHGRGVISVTSSIGLALGNTPASAGMTVEELVNSADMALLGAKQDGRNQVTVGQTAA